MEINPTATPLSLTRETSQPLPTTEPATEQQAAATAAPAPLEDTVEISTEGQLTLRKETLLQLSPGEGTNTAGTDTRTMPPDISDVGCPTK